MLYFLYFAFCTCVRNMYTNSGQETSFKMSYSELKTKVYGRICAKPPGLIWGVGDFGDFGSSDAVGKTLQRLTATGQLRRIDRGLYDRPKTNQLTGKPSVPDYRAIIEAIARRDKTRMLVDGMTAANELGLSDAVSGQVVIQSDARLKPIKVGNLPITFKMTAASKLYWAGRPAMRIVQALHWLKPKLEIPEDRAHIITRINALLSDPKHGATLRNDLIDGFSALPVWMQDVVKKFKLSKKSSKNPKQKTAQT
jgi:Family of unknown function (DUF6088)